jgi:hypothetical protein
MPAAVDEQLRFHDALEETRDAFAAFVAPQLRARDGGFVLTKTVKTGVLRWRVA